MFSGAKVTTSCCGWLPDGVGFREAKEAAQRARATGSFSPALWPVGRGFAWVHFHPS